MATNNKNRFIQLPNINWLTSKYPEYTDNDRSLLFQSHPIDVADQGDIYLVSAFNKNKLAFFCDKAGKMILRMGSPYYHTFPEPIKFLSSGLIASECRKTEVSINYDKNDEGMEEVTYTTDNVSRITTPKKDWTWNTYGSGALDLSCRTGDLKGNDLAGLKNKVHSLMLAELNNVDKWPIPNILDISNDENTVRDTLSTVKYGQIPWPSDTENELQLEYSASLGRISYARAESIYGRKNLDGEEFEESYVREKLFAEKGMCRQTSVVFPLLRGPKRVEVSASIVAASSSLSNDLMQSHLKDVPVYIVWGKIGESLETDTGSILDSKMPDLGIGRDKDGISGADGGYPSFSGVTSFGDNSNRKGMAITLTDTSDHACVCNIPETHVMWIKVGVDIKKFFNSSNNIIEEETLVEKPELGPGDRYTKLSRKTDFSVDISVKLRFRVVA